MFERRQQRAADVSNLLDQLADEIDTGLCDIGWERQRLLPAKLAVFTRRIEKGDYFATLEVINGGGPSGLVRAFQDWPVRLILRYGCGHRPTVEMLPRVDLDADPVLIEEPVAGQTFATFTLFGAGDAESVVAQVVDDAANHSIEFAQSHSSVDTMRSALADDRITPQDVRVELLPVFLLAAGRAQESLEMAEGYLARGMADEEFVRRLRQAAEPI